MEQLVIGIICNADQIDIKGNLETISNLSRIGMMLIDLGKHEYIPTILEDVFEHSQRLVDEYAVLRKEDKES